MHTFLPLFEDNHLLVLNKPAGLLTQPNDTEQSSLEEQAKAWLKAVYQKPGQVFLHAIHRLDKPVSGVVLFSKTSKALQRLQAAMRQKELQKIYWTWVEGTLPSSEGVLENFMKHDSFQASLTAKNHPQAKLARLYYKVLQTTSQGSLLEIKLETGRYHQIRLQCSVIGCPVWGDSKYGSQRPYFTGEIALHHKCLQVLHPVTHALLTFEAPLPAHFPNSLLL